MQVLAERDEALSQKYGVFSEQFVSIRFMNKEFRAAVKGGDLETLQRFMALGSEINSKDRFGQTALMIASHLGHVSIADYLIRQGADLDVTAKFNLSALMLAVVAGHSSIVKLLIEAGADTGVRGGEGCAGFSGKSVLDLAREYERNEVIDWLKDYIAAS